MAIDVDVTAEPAQVLRRAGDFLGSDPIRHNLILTLLHARLVDPVEGRYVIASDSGRVVGVVVQSPLSFMATITPMNPEVVSACVDALADEAGSLPGVSGEAPSAASFAGRWTERTNAAAVPFQGQRLYVAGEIAEPEHVPGELRQAGEADRESLLDWMIGFHDDIGEPVDDPEPGVSRRLSAGLFWIWDDAQPVSMAAVTTPVAGVTRVQAVYTPPPLRSQGYASACVARLSSMVTGAGTRCMLFADLANPVSNSVYRRIGYRSAAELLRYEFR